MSSASSDEEFASSRVDSLSTVSPAEDSVIDACFLNFFLLLPGCWPKEGCDEETDLSKGKDACADLTRRTVSSDQNSLLGILERAPIAGTGSPVLESI